MKDLTPIHSPPQPLAAQTWSSSGRPTNLAIPLRPVRIKRFLAFLLRLWWVPVLTLLLGLGGAIAFILLNPPTFVSSGRMWETVKLRLPEGTLFSEDIQNFLGTQAELLRSSRLQELALGALKGHQH
jgi:uncharacterized protein involved in exopolysaccharide biosynthesis